MEVSFKLSDKSTNAWIPEKLLWVNFHLTKHFILGFNTEGFKNNTELNEEQINTIRNKQIESYDCKLKHKLQVIYNSCEECNYKAKCNDLLKTIESDYFSIIKNTMLYDINKPRHVYYFDKRKEQETLVLIGGDGTIVVAVSKNRNSRRYRVKTCFREQYQAHPSFKILVDNDEHWFRINAIKFMDSKLSDEKLFKSVEKILLENWTNA